MRLRISQVVLRWLEVASVRVGALQGELLDLVPVLERLGRGHLVQRRRTLSEAVVELDEVEGRVSRHAHREDHDGEEGAELGLFALVGDGSGEAVSFGIERI